MDIRQTLNEHPRVSVAAIGVLLVLAVGFVWRLGGNADATVRDADRRYYSDDDGATYFADAVRATPFDRGGKPAVVAVVTRCKGGKPAVAYLMRLTTAGQQQMAAIDTRETAAAHLAGVERAASEVKKPGDRAWHPVDSPAGSRVTTPTCADGGAPDYVNP